MMRILLYLLAVIIFVVISSCQKEIGPTAELQCIYKDSSDHHYKSAVYQGVIDRYVARGLPGISVLVEDSGGTWIGCGGFADIEEGIRFTPCHISKAASITKLMIGTLFFILQEEGSIHIDDLVSEYIDNDILKKIDKSEGITIKQLMNHSSGIYDVITSSAFYLAVLNNPNKQWTQEELLKYVYHQTGYTFTYPYMAHYSNTNTLLLTMCIEKATAIPHERLLREKLLDRLKMDDTYYQGREDLPPTVAQGYFDLHNNGSIMNVSNLVTGSGNGYGGIFSTVFDLHVFIRALLVEKSIISQESLNIMQEFLHEDEDYYTGAGIVKKFTMKSTYGIGHTGRDLGYSADLFYFPEKGITMVFFVNYGTNGDSFLKPIFLDFESELVDRILD